MADRDKPPRPQEGEKQPRGTPSWTGQAARHHCPRPAAPACSFSARDTPPARRPSPWLRPPLPPHPSAALPSHPVTLSPRLTFRSPTSSGCLLQRQRSALCCARCASCCCFAPWWNYPFCRRPTCHGLGTKLLRFQARDTPLGRANKALCYGRGRRCCLSSLLLLAAYYNRRRPRSPLH